LSFSAAAEGRARIREAVRITGIAFMSRSYAAEAGVSSK
jgi:hypothetical protein